MTIQQLGKVNYSSITSEVLAEIHSGKVFEVVRNKRPDGVFLVRKPQTEDEVQALAETLRQIMLEPPPEKPKKGKSKKD